MFQRKSSCFPDIEKSLSERPDRAWRNLDYLILFNSTKRISRSGRQTINCNCVICSMLLFLLCHTSGTQSKKMKLITGKVKFRMFCLRHCELSAVTSLTSSFGKLLSQNFLHLFYSLLITVDLDTFHQFSGHSLIKKYTL